MDIFFVFIKLNYKKIVVYKTDFYLKIISVILWILAGLFNIYILFHNFEHLSNWNLNETKLLYSVWALSFGVYNSFLNGIMNLEKYIITGNLDCYLVKPISPLFLISFSKINVMGIGFLLFGIISTFYSCYLLSSIITIFRLFFLIITSILGGLLIYSICLILACSSFWIGKSNRLLRLGYDLHKFTQFPIDIYNKTTVFFLSVLIPFGFSNYFPVKFVINKDDSLLLATACILVPIFVFLVALQIWKFSLLHYEGGGA